MPAVAQAATPLLPCAQLLTNAQWRGLPLMRLRVAPTRTAPLQRLAQPLLMTLVRGRVQLQSRQAHGVGTSTLLPADAQARDDRWSSEGLAEFIGVALPLSACEAQLPTLPRWARPHTAPARFADPRVLHWVGELHGQCLHGEPLGSLYTEAVSAALLAYLHARYGDDARRADVPRGNQAAMARVREYIEQQLAEPLKLADLAQLAGCSPAHLSRQFRAAFGEPVHRYVLRRRIELARALLAQPELGLAEVALACGFASQAHLTQAFKAALDITPGAWRRAVG